MLGKAGATAGAGLAGGTTSGAPTSGQFDVGEGVFGQDGSLWICTAAGSPGTFVQAGFANPLTTKADLLVGGAAGAASRLGVGSDNQVLTADSSQTLGLKWAITAANAGGALTQIAQTTLGASAASITFSSIPGTYTNLLVEVLCRGDTGSDVNLLLQYNGDTGSNYGDQALFAQGVTSGANKQGSTTSQRCGQVQGAGASSVASVNRITIYSYPGTAWAKVARSEIAEIDSTTTGGLVILFGGLWTSTAAITSLKLFPQSGNFVTNTVATLYGVS